MPDVRMSRGEFLSAVAAAKNRDRIVYHVGYLPRDRSRGIDHVRLAQLAVAAMDAAERGEVHLFQRKLAPATDLVCGTYEYIAQKRDPAVPSEWVGCYAHSKRRAEPDVRAVDRAMARKRPNPQPPPRTDVQDAA